MSASGSPEGQRARSASLLVATRKNRHVPATSSRRIQAGNHASMSRSFAAGDNAHDILRPRTGSTSSQAAALGRTPNRSFYHRSFHGQLDPAQYSFAGVQEQTAELASLAYSENASVSAVFSDHSSIASDEAADRPEAIEEVSEPVTPQEPCEDEPSTRNNIHHTYEVQARPVEHQDRQAQDNINIPATFLHETMFREDANERTALLVDHKRHSLDDASRDMESQLNPKSVTHPHWYTTPTARVRSCMSITFRPKSWSAKGIWREAVVHPVSVLPAVFLGLLLNILDALSYGMILFPLGEKLFEDLGSDGIAMFYVSTVISQLVYSSGGSIFRGGIGSEMIEVVPFMHKMALMILAKVGEDNKESVLATTVLSFSISAVLTGAVFFAMGACGLGSLIGFFPRHILIGCIGGVGWFLVVTGVEVSARLPGNLEYNLDTLKQLFRADTVALWVVPLVLAIILLITQRYVKSNFLVGGYFVSIAAIFYFFKFALDIQMDTLHSRGWVFDSPPAGNPWYHFWTLYNFKAVDWEALMETLPTMFALTFFGILHVPINVPALGISTGEDNLNVDRELIAHGISNTMSGLCGSVQNYLVYTNSLLFMDSGGNDRLAGLMLAAATFGILLAGPVIIGFIPIMVVGALIFLLGIELLEEALWDTAGKVHRLEYLTILIIVVTMGVWDFVAGILVGIILAALNFVVQTSRRTAIRAEYSGVIAQSTVRRPPVQHKFLKETGKQIFVLKLAGFLFFGTIVGVESRIRALLAEDAFDSMPLRFVVLDMSSINGIDFSAAEAFTRVNRLLQKRGVKLCISALELDGEIGRALRNVGLFSETSEVEAFETLNQALQNCENMLLSALYRQERQRLGRLARRTSNLDVPISRASLDLSSSYRQEFLSSPRQNQLHHAATTTLEEDNLNLDKWSAFKQPLPLIMQIFQDISDKGEDFWHRATKYFERACFPKGSILFEVGDTPQGFYLVEEGMLRADYDLPQGKYSELVVERRPCGELPFFSSTARTANMVAETDCVLWVLSAAGWQDLQKEEPNIAQEVLKITLKLTKERMDAITSYVMTAAG